VSHDDDADDALLHVKHNAKGHATTQQRKVGIISIVARTSSRWCLHASGGLGVERRYRDPPYEHREKGERRRRKASNFGKCIFLLFLFFLSLHCLLGRALLVTRPWEGVVGVWRLHLFINMAVAICAIALLFHKQALLACLVRLLPGAGDGGSALEPTPLIETNGGLPLLGRCGGL
jgi:hypothetical protein